MPEVRNHELRKLEWESSWWLASNQAHPLRPGSKTRPEVRNFPAATTIVASKKGGALLPLPLQEKARIGVQQPKVWCTRLGQGRPLPCARPISANTSSALQNRESKPCFWPSDRCFTLDKPRRTLLVASEARELHQQANPAFIGAHAVLVLAPSPRTPLHAFGPPIAALPRTSRAGRCLSLLKQKSFTSRQTLLPLVPTLP